MKVIKSEFIDIIDRTLAQITDDEVQNFVDALDFAFRIYRKVFIIGSGRSGLVGKMFAMRLMHMGLRVHVVGEVTAPAIDSGDLLIVISKSLSGCVVRNALSVAKKNGANIFYITSDSSGLGDRCDAIKIPNVGDSEYFPMGSKFEMCTNIFLELVTAKSMKQFCVKEDDMKLRHTNME